MAYLELSGVRKSYGAVKALSGVDLSVDAGEVHALLGANGAGKSTLMKTIAGAVVPDEGRLTLNGEEVPFGSPELARRRGIGIVYQELSLIPSMTIGENVLLGRWPTTRGGTVEWRRLYRNAQVHLDRLGLDLDPRDGLNGLGMAERQLVEIAKALSSDVRILLLDEPTSALSDREVGRLFEVIRGLAASGVGIVYVSHRLAEVLEIADRITVFRDGRRVETLDAAGADEGLLARLMVGHSLESEPRQAAADTHRGDADVVLRLRGLGRPPRLKPVDLELRAGEIVGVFGLVGAGRTRLARTLFGLEPASEGTIEVLGHQMLIRSPAKAIAAGLGYVGEDRAAGLVPRMSVAANVTLASLGAVSHGPVLSFAREREVARRYLDDLAIRSDALDHPVEALSGGNQQKVVLARWLCSGARILILDDPTRGIDVGVKEDVFRLIRTLAGEGVAILYLTSELKEAQTLPHRLLVMANGQIAGTVPPRTSEEEIMQLAGGVNA